MDGRECVREPCIAVFTQFIDLTLAHTPAPSENWNAASQDFFESFKQFDESGSPQRIQVLKYLVLSYMLMGSEINPFDSQETKP